MSLRSYNLKSLKRSWSFFCCSNSFNHCALVCIPLSSTSNQVVGQHVPKGSKVVLSEHFKNLLFVGDYLLYDGSSDSTSLAGVSSFAVES